MPRIKTGAPTTPEEQLKTRKERAAAKAQTVTVGHKVPDDDRRCKACSNRKLAPLGEGKMTSVFEFVPARFLRVEHVQEVLRCRCNGFVIAVPGAPKVVEKGQNARRSLHISPPRSVPIARRSTTQKKAFQQQGIPIARSTMNELLHRASAIVDPTWSRLLVVRVRPVVAADETRLRIVRNKRGKTKNGFIWTFGARDGDVPDLRGLDASRVPLRT